MFGVLISLFFFFALGNAQRPMSNVRYPEYQQTSGYNPTMSNVRYPEQYQQTSGYNPNYENIRSENQQQQNSFDCSNWGQWDESRQCVWPPCFPFDQLPNICRNPPFPQQFPQAAARMYQRKIEEYYDMMATNLRQRGADQACGRCGFRVRCRSRQPSFGSSKSFCSTFEEQYITDSQCSSEQPCRLRMENGMCPGPYDELAKELAKGKSGKKFQIPIRFAFKFIFSTRSCDPIDGANDDENATKRRSADGRTGKFRHPKYAKVFDD